MTGAAHTSTTASIFQRPRFVRSASGPACCGTGIECTVSPSGWSKAPGLAAVGEEELEPDIEDRDRRGDGPPLEGIAVILFSAAAGLRPLPQQPFGGGARLLHRERQQWQAGFRSEAAQVEILPDSARLFRVERIKLGRGRGQAASHF